MDRCPCSAFRNARARGAVRMSHTPCGCGCRASPGLQCVGAVFCQVAGLCLACGAPSRAFPIDWHHCCPLPPQAGLPPAPSPQRPGAAGGHCRQSAAALCRAAANAPGREGARASVAQPPRRGGPGRGARGRSRPGAKARGERPRAAPPCRGGPQEADTGPQDTKARGPGGRSHTAPGRDQARRSGRPPGGGDRPRADGRREARGQGAAGHRAAAQRPRQGAKGPAAPGGEAARGRVKKPPHTAKGPPLAAGQRASECPPERGAERGRKPCARAAEFPIFIGGYYDTPQWVLCALCSDLQNAVELY